jgi:hypothetical protein
MVHKFLSFRICISRFWSNFVVSVLDGIHIVHAVWRHVGEDTIAELYWPWRQSLSFVMAAFEHMC